MPSRYATVAALRADLQFASGPEYDGERKGLIGMGDTKDAHVERLSTAECWALLEETQLGRLAVVNVDGRPDIFPVNYVSHDGSLFIRTARDAKLAHIAHHPAVAFEVDGDTDDSRWSVVVRGDAERVTRDDVIRNSGVRELASWSPTAKHFVIRIAAHTVSGRRFQKDGGRRDLLVPFDGPGSLTSPSQPRKADRARPPQPIPHVSPSPEPGEHPTTPRHDG